MTLAGSAISALFGFALSVVLARLLGPEGAGVVLQAIAVFMIALSLVRLGLDTTAVWLLPSLVRDERSRVRSALTGMLLPVLVVSAITSAACLLVSAVVDVSPGRAAVWDAISVAAIFLPAAAFMSVALAATRAFGGVLPFNLVSNVALPVLRPLLVAAAVGLGGATTMSSLGWAFPWALGAVAALVVLTRQVHRAVPGGAGSWWPDRELSRRIVDYSMPRAVAAGLEQTVIWLDVVLVGIIAGSAAAGVYGSAARFVSAGVIVATALRIVVAPRFSALLSQGRTAEVEQLYAVTARWILLFGAPIYLVLAIFGSTVLGWLGGGFTKGASSVAILSLGSIVVLAAGNVQSLLLMSGRSGWSAVNKVIVVVVNCAGNLVLVPRVGIVGAAATWAFSMALDTALAAYQVRRVTGIALHVGPIALTGAAVFGCVGVPASTVVMLFGQGTLQLFCGAAAGGVVLLGYCWLDRKRLHLSELSTLRST